MNRVLGFLWIVPVVNFTKVPVSSAHLTQAFFLSLHTVLAPLCVNASPHISAR